MARPLASNGLTQCRAPANIKCKDVKESALLRTTSPFNTHTMSSSATLLRLVFRTTFTSRTIRPLVTSIAQLCGASQSRYFSKTIQPQFINSKGIIRMIDELGKPWQKEECGQHLHHDSTLHKQGQRACTLGKNGMSKKDSEASTDSALELHSLLSSS